MSRPAHLTRLTIRIPRGLVRRYLTHLADRARMRRDTRNLHHLPDYLLRDLGLTRDGRPSDGS